MIIISTSIKYSFRLPPQQSYHYANNVVVHNLLIMKKEHIVLRTASIAADITKPRLLDSNGKRRSNNKIALYSNKYNNLMSTHSLPDGSHQPNLQTKPFLKTISDLASTELCDSHSQRFSFELKRPQEYESVVTRMNDQNLYAAIREQIDHVRNKYEVKMKELLEGNARIICQLRQTLTEQQRKLTQKQLLIQRLLAQRQLNGSVKKIINNAQTKNTQKLKQSQFLFLKNRIHDIDVKVMVLLEALSNGERQTLNKLSQLQQKLIENTGKKLANCKISLQVIICQFARKINAIQQILCAQSTQPKTHNNQNIKFDFMKLNILELQQKISVLSNKQWIYQSAEIPKLQFLLKSLSQKVDEAKGQLVHKGSNHYIQDQDEFFYPSTQRVYEASDQYEHFQQDSQDQSFKKENRSPNYFMNSKKES